MKRGCAIGVDIGGTKVLAVALDDTAGIVAEQRVPTPPDPEALVEAVSDAIDALGVPVASIGVGVAGLVTAQGEVRVSPHLAHPERLDLVGRLGRRFATAVRVENDATAATWGEARLGAGRGARDLVVVTLGTGIGAGIVCNGELVRGAHGFAGEPGHLTVNFDGDAHITGGRGSWELYASGTALRRSADGPLDLAALDTVEGYALLEAFARAVAIGLGNIVALLDPELIVLGGGVSVLGEPLRVAVERHLPEWVFGAHERDRLRVLLAELGEQAGAIGAALLGAGEGSAPKAGSEAPSGD